ncbi:MAG: geranylgeranylglycerol-phosphate geranylgeranyltransferase [Ignavibacteriales bacterium]|nr:geranylgeranylglycerol-phosphate geranylgeranyltransferase [Ignavibacteriales bacterium]
MNSEKLSAAIELLRPLNVLIIMLVIAASVLLAGGIEGNILKAIIAAVAGGLIGGAANAINDYFDVDIDRVNKPNRPLPRKSLTPRAAFLLWFSCSVVGISLNLFLHSPALEISVSAVAGLFVYSAVLKRTMLLGNVLVAVMTALAFIYGASVAGSPERAFFPALFAFLLNLGREVLKDIEDMRGDRLGNAGTLPIRHGVSTALTVATVSFVLLLGATLVPFTSGMSGMSYLVMIGIVDVILCYVIISMWMDAGSENLARLNTALKADMVLGLVALYIGL